MKKDIEFPEVKDVYVAVVKEQNKSYDTEDWNAYIINDKAVDLEVVIIVAKGYSQEKITTTMRHQIATLPAKSYAKIELMQEEVFALNNEFKVTFFEGNRMFDKTYLFRKTPLTTKPYKIFH